MNILKKFYARAFQDVFKLSIPLMPYRQPKILTNYSEVADIILNKKCRHAFIVTDKILNSLGYLSSLISELENNNIKSTIFDNVLPNPTVICIEEGVSLYKNNTCDCIIALGGGSVMDCAKIIGARAKKPKQQICKMKGILKIHKKLMPLIAIPTTAGTGSETTLAAVITDSEKHHKYVINDFSIIPHFALLDANLTVNLPKHLTSTTGMDALTHAVEAYIDNSTTKKTRMLSLEAIKSIFENIETAFNEPQNITARQNMLEASYMAGAAFTISYVGYCHSLAHALGGMYNTPHGLANAVILPYVLNAYGKSVHKKLKQIAVYCNLANKNTSAAQASKILINRINTLNKNLEIPQKLEHIKNSDIPTLIEHANSETIPLYPVPTFLSIDTMKSIYKSISKGDQNDK